MTFAPHHPLAALRNRRLLMCFGAGGVGKTTCAAALALRAALEGTRVVALTIDPAPRLLEALGLPADTSEPTPVTAGSLTQQLSGSMKAMRLDPARTFDGLVARYAPSERVREAILQNRIYRNLNAAFPGLASYMAGEKLVELSAARDIDLVVLDTPPASEALDFIAAPQRLAAMMNSRAVSILGAFQSGIGMGDRAARAVLRVFDRITRLHLLDQVEEFVRAFSGMYEGFAQRALEAEKLMRDAASLAVIVTTAEPHRLAETERLAAALRRSGINPGMVVVNRVLPDLPRRLKHLGIATDSQMRSRLNRAYRQIAGLAANQRRTLAHLRKTFDPSIPILVAGELLHPPRNLNDLQELAFFRSITSTAAPLSRLRP